MKSRKLVALLCQPRGNMSGGTVAEYSVITAAICLVLAAVIFFFGQDIANTFTALRDTFTHTT